MKICFMFPGQGTQKPGMMRELGRNVDQVRYIFDLGSEVSGRDIQWLCSQAPAEELQQTENTQLAVTAMNLAYYQLACGAGAVPHIVLGHSLGQFSALVAAGVLTIKQAFEIVCKRAQLMGSIQKEGMLCTVLGLNYKQVADVCISVDPSSTDLVVALHNTSNQIVVGGSRENVLKAESLCKKRGALRTVPVRVSNAFHTPLMREMEDEFSDFIEKIEMRPPQCALLLNCKGDYAADVEDIKREIKRQCCHTVRWYDCLQKIVGQQDTLFAEVGIGRTLTGMIRSVDPEKAVYMLSNPKQFEQFIKQVDTNKAYA